MLGVVLGERVFPLFRKCWNIFGRKNLLVHTFVGQVLGLSFSHVPADASTPPLLLGRLNPESTRARQTLGCFSSSNFNC